jgi:hypothetical protein
MSTDGYNSSEGAVLEFETSSETEQTEFERMSDQRTTNRGSIAEFENPDDVRQPPEWIVNDRNKRFDEKAVKIENSGEPKSINCGT